MNKKHLKKIIREELLVEVEGGNPVPGALNTSDKWSGAFMSMIKKELESSGWSIGVIGPEIVTAMEQLITQIKKESDQANKDAMDSY